MVRELCILIFIMVGLCGCAIYDLSPTKEDYAPADPAGDTNRLGRQQSRQAAEKTADDNGYSSSVALPNLSYTVPQKNFSSQVLSIRLSCVSSGNPYPKNVRYKSLGWTISTPTGEKIFEHRDMTNSDGFLIISAERSYFASPNILSVADQKISISDLYKNDLELQIACPP